MALFAIGILLARNIWCLCANVTTIEGWEIERHESLVRRAKVKGGCVDSPDGNRMMITHKEFPYDVGIMRNIRQGMGTSIFLWMFPFAPTPLNQLGLSFETNGFDGTYYWSMLNSDLTFADDSWPPPDPDRMPRRLAPIRDPSAFTYGQSAITKDQQRKAFRLRQQEDLRRFDFGPYSAFGKRELSAHTIDKGTSSGLRGWRDSEGESLGDFGVDENVEFHDDDVPLSELLRRRW